MNSIPGQRMFADDAAKYVEAHGGVLIEVGSIIKRWRCRGNNMITVDGSWGMLCPYPPSAFTLDEMEESILAEEQFMGTLESRVISGVIAINGRSPKLREIGSAVDAWIDASGRDAHSALGSREEQFGDICAVVGSCLSVECDGVWAADPWCATRVPSIWLPKGVFRVGHIVMHTIGLDKPTGVPLSGVVLAEEVQKELERLS